MGAKIICRYFFTFLVGIVYLTTTISCDYPTPLCIQPQIEVNEYIDNLLKKKDSYISDPMKLPDRTDSLSLSKGELRGLSTLRRASSISVKCDKEASLAAFIGKFRSDSLSMQYQWSYEIKWFYNGSGAVTVESPNFNVFAKVIYTKSEEVRSLKVHKLEVKDLDDLEVSYSGTGSWILPAITRMIIPFLKSTLKDLIEDTLLKEINDELSQKFQ